MRAFELGIAASRLSEDPPAKEEKVDFYVRRYKELFSHLDNSPLERINLLEFYGTYHSFLYAEIPQRADTDEEKEEFGAGGGFEMLQQLLPRLLAVARLRFGMRGLGMMFVQKAITVGWQMTIAYEPNKFRAALILQPWCDILQESASRLKALRQARRGNELSEQEEEDFAAWLEVASIAVHGVWSFCYGVLENHRAVFDLGAVASLAELLNDQEMEYPVVGTFWHMCESSFVCEELLSLGLLERLSELPIRGKKSKNAGLLASLALARMSLYGSSRVKERLVKANAFESIQGWVEAHDPLVFKNFFVWTSTKLITELLESEYYQVRLLGCFFVVVIMKENARKRDLVEREKTQGKLLYEGVASMLANIIKNDHYPLLVSYATLGSSKFTSLTDVEYYRSNCMLWNLFQNRAFFESKEIVGNLSQYESKAVSFVIGTKDESSLLSLLPYDLSQYVLLMLFSLPNESGLSLSQSFSKKRKLADSNSS